MSPSCRLAEVIYRLIVNECPVEGELVTTVRVVGEIAGVDTIGDDENLDVIKQTTEGGFLITLDLIVCLLQFYATFLELNLYKRKAVDEDGDIVTTGSAALDGNLIGDLEFVLAPVVFIEELYPNAMLAVLGFHREKVTKLLGLLEEGSTFQIDADLLKFLIGKCCAADFGQSLSIMFFQLLLKVAEQVRFFLDLDILIAHVLQGRDQPVLKSLFALCRHFA